MTPGNGEPFAATESATARWLRRVASLAAQAGSEAEQAALRILIVAVLLGYVLALQPLAGGRAESIPLLAAWLAAASAILLWVLMWPRSPALRPHALAAPDIALFSAFLHLGGGDVAGWYPLYLAAVFYAGLRFGAGALASAAILSTLGFGAVVLTTAMWRELPYLAAGLICALLVLPALFAGPIRVLSAARTRLAQAQAERRHELLLIADALCSDCPIGDVRDFATLEAGALAPPLATFDLRALVWQALAPLQPNAENRPALRWRVDPRLPWRLRGRARALARILSGLADYAMRASPGPTVCIAIEGSGRDGQQITLRVQVDGLPEAADGAVTPLALRLVERLAAVAGGAFGIETTGRQRSRLVVTLPLQIEADTPQPALDLRRRPVLIVTEDDGLARDMANALTAWNAQPRRPGDLDRALAEIAPPGTARRPIVIIDAREKLLAALGLADRTARLRPTPFVLLVAEDTQIERLTEIENGELDGFIPTPVTEELLANAIDGLPLEPERPMPQTTGSRQAASEGPQPAAGLAIQADGERITAISAHPKFVPEPAAAVDLRVIERLHTLGGGPAFMRDMIDAFMADARQIVGRLEEAIAAADPASFARDLMALQRMAGHLGGAQLCELAASLRSLTSSELRQQGGAHLQRLQSEIDRLAIALMEHAPAPEARRP